MNLPGFTAEASLRTSATAIDFSSVARSEHQSFSDRVIPSFRRQAIGGCGACTELKWPNGTGTGACVQDCCDLLGKCTIQACTCGGGGGLSSIVRSFGLGSFVLR